MPIYTFETNAGYRLRGSHNDSIVIARNGKIQKVKVKNISEGDCIVISQESQLSKSTTPLKPVEGERHHNEIQHDLPKSVTSDLAFMLGYLLTDGTFDARECRLVFSTGNTPRETELRDRLVQIFEKWGLSPNLSDKSNSDKGNYTEVTVHSSHLIDWMLVNNLHKDFDNVPKTIYQTPHVIPDFLAGLSADAGYNEDGSTAIYWTTSEELAEKIQKLFLVAGIPTHRNVSRNRDNAFGDKPMHYVYPSPGHAAERFDELVPHAFDDKFGDGGERQNQVWFASELLDRLLNDRFKKNHALPSYVDRKAMKELRRYQRGERVPSRNRLVKMLDAVGITDVPELDDSYLFQQISSFKVIDGGDYNIHPINNINRYVKYQDGVF